MAYQDTPNDDELRGRYSPLPAKSEDPVVHSSKNDERKVKETCENKPYESEDICVPSEKNNVGKETAFDNPAYVPAMELLGTYQLTTEL